MRIVRIAARKSDLARIQAYSVGHKLAERASDIAIEYEFRESLGDLNSTDPLWQMPEQGVFTQDFYLGLCEGRWDLVVHSWKDLPLERRVATEVIATLPRADARDMLLVPRKAWLRAQESRRLRVLSSSPRRIYNLQSFLSEALPVADLKLEFLPVRGNIPTRIRKLFAGEGDALIVAKAALDRLLAAQEAEFLEVQKQLRVWLNDSYWMVLPISQNPTAAAQGALAIEIAVTNSRVRELLKNIHCARTFAEVEEERKILATYGGGCHQKIGVHVVNQSYGQVLSLRGLTNNGQRLEQFSVRSPNILPKAESSKLWPERVNTEVFFTREFFSGLANPGTALIVPKAESLPQDWKISPEQIIWTGGVQTWKRLARRGIWVHGTFDGLGEKKLGLGQLLGENIEFTKLSHQQSAASADNSFLATYSLQTKQELPPLQGKTHFFWSSGSQFSRALELYPEIRHAEHACGPGSTYRLLSTKLPDPTKIHVFLSHEEWLREVTQ